MLRKGDLALIALETAASGVGGLCGLLFKAGVCKAYGVEDEVELAEKIEKKDKEKKKAIAEKKRSKEKKE